MTDDAAEPLQLRLYRLAQRVVPRLPVALSYWLADRVADGLWLGARRARSNFEHNQRRALGPTATPRAVALSSREAIRNLAKIYVDEFRLSTLSDQEVRDSVTVHGLEHLEAAHAQGKGVILASAHYGSPQMVGQLLAILGYPTTVVVEHVKPEALFRFISEMRQSHGVRLLPIDGPLLGLIRTLKREKGVVGLVCDRDVSGSGLRMSFLGEETSVADGPAALALRTGSPIVLAYCRRRGTRFEAFVEPAIELPTKPDDPDAAIRAATAELMQRMARFIWEEPGQWVLSQPLWAATAPPPGA